MKGSPAKLGTIQGTSGHRAAQNEASPAKFNLAGGFGDLVTGDTTGSGSVWDNFKSASLVGGNKSHGEWQDVLEEENLDKNMWSGTIFGRKRDRERKRRLKELRAKKKLGQDRNRIAKSVQETTLAGPGGAPTEVEEV